jgi:hypothetical protein
LLRTTFVKLGAVLGAACIALPAAIAAADPPSSPTGGMAFADDASLPVVTPDGSMLDGPLGELLGGSLAFSGRLAGTHPGDGVVVQRLDGTLGWTTAATTIVAADGTFAATWRADQLGRTTVRAVPAEQPATAVAASALPVRDVAVFRPVTATWYGPGFYGRRTACGMRLTKRLLGVAHRKLPCGTQVEFLHEGRSISVPVVDRGPFRHGAHYDLTAATARALGITTTSRIGALRVTPPPAALVAPAPAPARAS